MRNLFFAALLVASTPALALAADALGPDSVLGTTLDEVTASLTGMGYEIRKAEMEDGKIEVYFVNDTQMGEVYVDPTTGKILKLEIE